MIYNLIYEELLLLFGNSVSWIITAVEILALIFTIIFILLFLSIPLFLFYNFITLFAETKNKRRRKRK